jgi:mRNA-degrading endonuclease toxin of MazEF toxin-antitoxin module
VLVLGRPSVLPSLSLIVVVPLSTTVRSLPWEVMLGEDDGVLARSALKVEWIRAVDRKLLGRASPHCRTADGAPSATRFCSCWVSTTRALARAEPPP